MGGPCLWQSPHSGYPETPFQRCAVWEELLEEPSSGAVEGEELAARGWELFQASSLLPQRGPGLQLEVGDSHRLSWVVGLGDLGGRAHGVQEERWVLVGSWAKDQQVQGAQEAQEARQDLLEEGWVPGVEVGDGVGTP